MISSFIKQLKVRLESPLPGLTSHHLMLPSTKGGGKIRFQHSLNPRPGAVLILFYEENGVIRFPMIQRPVYEGVHSGQIALPGGKQETTDQTLYDTALRESNEEIGIFAEKVQVIGALSSFLVAASNHVVLPVLGVYPEIPVFYPDKHEVDEVISVPVDDLMDDQRMKRTFIQVRDAIQLDSPYFDLENKIVWGATAGILNELKTLIREMYDG